ncbi:MAG: T9SS type A sorting domain-containing protein [Saprospiraceae bacterium]|nr:T9SS type A sorting domain-containing protein [Saprospiraceae bacterium]
MNYKLLQIIITKTLRKQRRGLQPSTLSYFRFIIIAALLVKGKSIATAQSWQCGDTLVDSRDGQKYPTVLIGSQCWMAKNLNIGTYTESFYTGTSHSDMANNGIIEKYCYNNDTANCELYGGLYEWDEMTNYTTVGGSLPDTVNRGICPTGWHIPSSGSVFGASGTTMEWEILELHFPPTTEAIELMPGGSSGFNAQLGGYRTEYGQWDTIYTTAILGGGRCGNYWSTLSSFADNRLGRTFHTNHDSLTVLYDSRFLGLSVRCIKDSDLTISIAELPSNKTALKVYPSPAESYVSVVLNCPAPNEPLLVYNIFGQEVRLPVQKSNEKLKLDIITLPPGIYFVRLGTYTGCFIKASISH